MASIQEIYTKKYYERQSSSTKDSRVVDKNPNSVYMPVADVRPTPRDLNEKNKDDKGIQVIDITGVSMLNGATYQLTPSRDGRPERVDIYSENGIPVREVPQKIERGFVGTWEKPRTKRGSGRPGPMQIALLHAAERRKNDPARRIRRNKRK